MDEYVERSQHVDSWEQLVDYLTSDMNPDDIDVVKLSERFNEHISAMEESGLEVPAKAVKVCSHLLKIKAYSAAGSPIHLDDEDAGEPTSLESQEESSKVQYREGPTLDMPARPRVSRQVTKSELKESLADALELKRSREQEVERRRDFEEDLDMDEETLQDKIDNLISRLSSLMGGGNEESVEFEQLIEDKMPEQQLEKFLHVLHLEDERKVKCEQEEFLGDLKVRPKDI